MEGKCPTRETLDQIFPPERSNAFFEALYGDADEGAYDIRLVCKNIQDKKANLAFELIRRPGKCLRCNLTYGLPEVFSRHPIINAKDVASQIAKELGWNGAINWSFGATQDINDDLSLVPFVVEAS